MKAHQPWHQYCLHFNTGLISRWDSTQVSTDQVIIRMLGLEHSRDVLQVVRVYLLRAPPGEGHGDDTLRDVRQVEFISLLHPDCWDLLLKITKQVAQALQLPHTIPTLSRWLCSSQYLTVKVLSVSHCVRVSRRYLWRMTSIPDCMTEGDLFAQKRSTVCIAHAVLVETKQYIKGFGTCGRWLPLIPAAKRDAAQRYQKIEHQQFRVHC